MLKSYELKLNRANHHISNCEAVFNAWLRTGYRVFEQSNSKGHVELAAEMLEAIPDEIVLIIGDAIHCLRDSLDHIIFELALLNTPELTPQQERNSQFPIFDNPINIGHNTIECMPLPAQKAIVNLLPGPSRNKFSNNPLWLLNKMNNRDKHRTIPVVVASSGVQQFEINYLAPSDHFRIIGTARPVVGGGPIAFMEYSRSANIKAYIRGSTKILFNKGCEVEGREVIIWLRDVHKYITDIVVAALK